ncbi:EF-hand domain-containing protein [Candidatus Sumerlaeota bacterium]|nr:EF-hand domain-containing protein [Candidatus Sumerlaeota bacterium]
MNASKAIMLGLLSVALMAFSTASPAQQEGHGRQRMLRGPNRREPQDRMRNSRIMSDPQRQAEAFVQKFDSNGDGVVSDSEFPGNPNRLNELDSDGDGKVSVEEYAAQARQRQQRMNNLRDLDGPPEQDGPPPGNRVMRNLQETLKRMDADQSETLSPEEFKAGVETLFQALDRNQDGELDRMEIGLPPPPLSEEERERIVQAVRERFVERVMERMDANEDGAISQDEWNGLRARFKRIDANSDGTLSAEELSDSVEQSAEFQDNTPRLPPEFDDSLFDELFQRRDLNQNGKIERDEFHGSDVAFQEADQNENGVLSWNEARIYMQRHMARLGRLRIGGPAHNTEEQNHPPYGPPDFDDGERDDMDPAGMMPPPPPGFPPEWDELF